jgi:hypothetical protein
MKTRKKFLPLALLLLPACAADPSLVTAGRQFYMAVAPEYALYVEADPALTREQKDSRHLSIKLFHEALLIREEAQPK